MTAMMFNFVLSVLFISVATQAQTVSSKNDNREAQFLTEVAQKADPDQATTQSFLEEIPDGLSTKDISPACDPKIFEDSVLSKKRSSAEYFKLAKDYFKRCEYELSARSPKGVIALLKYSMYKYPFLQHPQVSEFTMKLSNGVQLPAIMALKQDGRPRPLVVVKCGTFCSASESPSMKAYLMSLFDQSPFNVVLLASQTGLDYMALNHVVQLGGYSEGYEALLAGKWLKEQWAYRDRISSMHLMGISLGGSAAIYGATYNDMYPQTDGSKVFSSVAAICPVVSLKPTLEHLYSSFIVGPIFAKLTKNQFMDARGDLADVPDLLVEGRIPKKTAEMADFLGELTSTSLQRRGIASTPSSYFKSNNFWNLRTKIQTPMLVWASKNDIIVNNKINARVIEQDDYYEKSPNVGVLNLSYGSHCGFHGAYGPLAASTVLRTFVMSHSPEFSANYQQNTTPWNFGFKKMYSVEEHVGQSFEFASKSSDVKVSFRIFNWSGKQCQEQGPWAGNGMCITTKSYTVPVTSLKQLGARVPRNNIEAQTLSREFNTKVEFRTKDQKPLNGSSASEFVMTWRTAFE
ncbi:alpha/beta hydrolase family protein [Bdellovibrio svalbardensis]|uniref:Uncharacterized protein n=1 Tax=Bdellovibrio svalbardensis TaxID=2972972 RepID=A0ABT6DMH5_9BACT|nr:hypothetical protein [Bdellovibrio svalbardensis]MDG0818065.1 hypothetical protein [Bdellovibrio svalbardensis]